MTTISGASTSGQKLTSILPPAPAPDPAQILALQTPPNAPTLDSLVTATNLLNVPPSMAARLRNFPEEIYTLNSTDHLVRLIKVLIGDAGAGQLRKRMMLARMSTVIQGANYYDLDSFYGSLYGVLRRSDEKLPLNPYTDLGTADTWSTARALDAAYRARIDQFGKAISFGPSAIGMELIAEAILQVKCSIYESWVTDDSGTPGSTNRKIFTVVPHRSITLEEDFDLRRVLNKMKPADTVVNITDAGNAVHTPIAISGIYADSTYWELVESIIANSTYAQYYNLSSSIQPGGWRELLRAPFTEYQGEQISYGGDIAAVQAYDQDDAGAIIANQVIDSYTFSDGTTFHYPPSQAIATRFHSLSGRYVSDGILQAAPYSASGPNVPKTSASNVPPLDLYVDGMPITDLLSAIESRTSNNLGVGTADQRFWSTPPRPATDNRTEVLDVFLVASRLVNSIALSVAHFPQQVQVQIMNPTNNEWDTIFSRKIFGSVPSIVPNATAVAHQHPQHSAYGAWTTFQIAIPPTEMSQVRILLQRIDQGSPPVQAQLSSSLGIGGSNSTITTPIPYSLGVRDFTLGYQVSQEDDLPPDPLITQDALGSQVRFSVRKEDADNTINGSGIPWRCSPQPTSDSVVNLYIDARDGNGNPQLVDRIFMDPLYLGPHCTVYYSNDDTVALGFKANAIDIVPPNLTPSGNITPLSTGLEFDTASVSYVDINNRKTQLDPSEPWWCGVSLKPWFDSATGHGQTVWDFGNGLNLKVQNNSFLLSGGIGSVSLSGISFSAGDTITLIAAYIPTATSDFNAGMYIFYGNNNPINTEQGYLFQGRMVKPDVSPIFSTRYVIGGFSATFAPGDLGISQPDLRFGAVQTTPTIPAGFTLMGLALKQTPLVVADLNEFALHYQEYTTLNGTHSQNAVLRWDGGNITAINQYGFVGGPGDFWAKLNWTPIMRNYVLQKGYMELPPTAAPFFNLEFTNLIAQPHASLIPIAKSVNTHQGLSDTVVQQATTPLYNNPGASLIGVSDNIDLAPVMFFGDSPLLSMPQTIPVNPTTPQPTMMQTAPDLDTQTTLANSAWFWQYQTWSTHSDAPRFIATGVHNYKTQEIEQSTQVSYFVGLNTIEVDRVNFAAENDSTMYEETFFDDTFIATKPIPQNPGDLNTVGVSTLPVQDVSATYNSTSNVLGVQFATVQSDAVEIAFDDDFSNPGLDTTKLNNRTNTDTNDAHVVGNASLVLQQTTQNVLVNRNTVHPSPRKEEGELDEPIVYPIFDQRSSDYSAAAKAINPFIGTYESQTGVVSPGYLDSEATFNYGGLENAYAPVTTTGTVYAAVRLTTNDVLASPLSLELINPLTGMVLASKAISCSPGQTVEEYVGFTLTGGAYAVAARIVQYGPASNSWIVDRLSTFETGVVWEFSNNNGSTWVNSQDVKNNPYGVVMFPSAGTQLKWRVTMSREDLHVHYLRIRPVYSGIHSDDPLGIVRGPNLSVYDQTPPITEDPFFTQWSVPIPYWWFKASQEFSILGVVGQPISNSAYNKVYFGNGSESLPATTSSFTVGVRSFVRGPNESYPTTGEATRTLHHIDRPAETLTATDTILASKNLVLQGWGLTPWGDLPRHR